MSTETIEVGFFPGTKRHVFTQVGDWSIYVPMSHQANRMYNILRSLINEKDPDSSCTTSDDFLRAALGMAGRTKPLSKTTLYRVRTELVDLDMVRVETIQDRSGLRGQPKIIGRRYLVRRDPHDDRPHVSSSWDLRKRFDELEEKGLSPAKMNTSSDLNSALLSGNTCSDLSHSGSDLNKHERSDLHLAGPKNPSVKNPPPPPPPSKRLAARGGRGSGRMKDDEEKDIKDFSHTYLDIAESLVRGLPGSITGTDHQTLVRLVCAAFDGGWSPSGLTEHLRANCLVDRVRFPGRVYVKHAGKDLPAPKAGEAARALVELCGVCDATGFTDEVAACSKDPQASPGVCLHGRSDPWDDPQYRAVKEAERAEAVQAHLRAQEQAREVQEEKRRARAQQELHRRGQMGLRRRAAEEFLASAPSTGSADADMVRRWFLTASDPAALEDVEGLVSQALGLVDLGMSMDWIECLIDTTPREEWGERMYQRLPAVSQEAA